ncbi:hypothetical protein GGI24_001451 [Coemansia furcata]|nr:hypothetical protein GGI24_001451 [Coemansia furcata]
MDSYDGVGKDKSHIEWPSSPQKPSSAIYHLVKTLEIRIDYWAVYSGEALKMLSAPPFDGIAFPLVDKLLVNFHYSYRESEESDRRSPRDAMSNIKEFVQRIEDMAPATGEVVIDTHDMFTDSIRNSGLNYADLFRRLFGIAKTMIGFNDPYGDMERCVNMDEIRDLVRLTCRIYDRSAQVVALARRSTQTLQYLDIRSYSSAGIIELIQDPISGEYADCVKRRLIFSENTASDPATAVSYLQLAMSIAPGASVLQFASLQVYDEIVPSALSVIGSNISIQVLSLPDITLTLWDAISLIKSLPLLSDLTTGTPKLGKLPWDITTTNLPKHVLANYAPMGERFRCWRITYHRTQKVKKLATVMLLLALACPTFNYAFQSALVTRAAERHFDRVLGQFNWEAVASELDIPLIECLDLFDASNSTIQPRSLIETYGGWAKTDMKSLKQFIAANYADSSTISWTIAGAYMNVDPLECQRVGLGTFSEQLNEAGYRRICELRDSGLSWKDVHQHFLQYPNVTSLHRRYYWFKVKLEGKTPIKLSARWTDVERERMKDLINRHVKSATRSELVDIIKRELPARPLSDIRPLFDRYVRNLKTGYMSLDQMPRMRGLVDEYGDNWDRIGEALDVLPSRARHNWIKHGGDVGDHSGWSADETHRLQHLTDSGIKPHEAFRLLGSKSRKWSTTDDEALLKMVDGSTLDTAGRWEQASKALGRSISACKARSCRLNRISKRKQVTDKPESLVTGEVKRQRKSSGAVDWSLVSQATGLGIRECLEQSQYDAGKANWRYDLDSFSQSMAGRMVGFIKENYPVPVPVNYRAVSNFMWISMDDCIRMHDMLQGKFKWTDLIGNYLAKHPHYQAKVCNIDFNDLANRVATGQTTVKLAAKELDIPSFLLASRVRNLDAKRFPLVWTEEEIRKLIDYAQSCDSKPDMVLFSKLLGTKSSNRCRNKLFYLRQKGILPSAKDMVK